MSSFEILCVTMNQNDFSKLNEMNIHSNVVFANQAGKVEYQETEFEDNKAKMITTNTKGVGINRNLALMYATADICLFADDDVYYNDDMQEKVLAEFKAHPDADIIIFHFETGHPVRKQVKYKKTKKCGPFTRKGWAGFRIAVRLNSIRKANLWFTTLMGGGCIFPSGEDSMFVIDAMRKGLSIYVSKESIGKVYFDKSTWFTGYDNKFYYAKGAMHTAVHPKSLYMWAMYIILRCRNCGDLSLKEKFKWILNGRKGYKAMLSYEDFLKSCGEE